MVLSDLPNDLVIHIATFSPEMRRLLRPVSRQFRMVLCDRVLDEYMEIQRYIVRLIDILDRHRIPGYVGMRKGIIKKVMGLCLTPRWRELISGFHPCVYKDIFPELLRRFDRRQ